MQLCKNYTLDNVLNKVGPSGPGDHGFQQDFTSTTFFWKGRVTESDITYSFTKNTEFG